MFNQQQEGYHGMKAKTSDGVPESRRNRGGERI
jgi:hypothetical protein